MRVSATFLPCAILMSLSATSASQSSEPLLLSSINANGEHLAAEQSSVYGGEPAGECEWPTSVSLEGCTATLVHPEIIMYAAHCGDTPRAARFGNTKDAGFEVTTESCKTHESNNGGFTAGDYAYCKLSRPVTELVPTPPAMGCELEALKEGKTVWVVGFGLTEDGTFDVKHKAEPELTRVQPDEVAAGGGGVDSCQGDSGGPLYVQLPVEEGFDGSWRAFGIVSNGGECGEGGSYAVMHEAAAWVEENSGIDITPCHDADGTWNPTENCKGFPMNPGAGAGTWAGGCELGEVGGWSATCGASFPSANDDMPPMISIATPEADSSVRLEGMMTEAMVTVTVTAEDGEMGSGVGVVTLLVDDVQVGEPDMEAPFEFEIPLGVGTHSLKAEGTDFAENTSQSMAVSLTVQPNDSTAPTVSVVSPTAGALVQLGPTETQAAITVTAQADDGVDGSGVGEVQLLVNGVSVGAPDAEAPYEFATSLAVGSHNLSVTASDLNGNLAESAAVALSVVAAPTAPPTTTAPPNGMAPAPGAAPAPVDSDSGCGCTIPGQTSPPEQRNAHLWLLLGVAAMLGRRRPRV